MIGICFIWLVSGLITAGYVMPANPSKDYWSTVKHVAIHIVEAIIAWPVMVGIILREKHERSK